MLHVQQVSGGYGNEAYVQDVSFTVQKGEILGVLGPNGSGKSTMLKLISGALPMLSGDVALQGKPLRAYAPKELAKKLAVLPQLHANTFTHTVREVVSLGRYPHQSGFFSSWRDEDERAVVQAMAQTNITQYADTEMEFLSGGEQQRVFVAQALAQKADVLFLDEPTNHLDIAHQRQLLDMVRTEAKMHGLTVVSIFHDMNLAALYCDRLLLMEKGRVRIIGEPHEVLIETQIEQVYDVDVVTRAHPKEATPQVTILPSVSLQQEARVTAEHIHITNEAVVLQSPLPLRVLSSAVYNAGLGWYRTLINRTVDPLYDVTNVRDDFAQFIRKLGAIPTNCVGMMTALTTDHAVIREFNSEAGHIIVAVTAGIGKAIDVSKACEHTLQYEVGTINTWVIVNGELTDEAFVQAMMTATEAKVKALQIEEVRDQTSNTIATGTATDSILIASTQHGQQHAYGGTASLLGKWVGHAVFETTVEAIQRYKQLKEMAR
ncbi:MAG: heme ABC transporter ATP-binding protein [Caryophanon sp.]|nr:heme ABC transporter ATP-binding protein [Caryophanon sp.]